MPIYAYTGLPGSGKSYSAVEQVVLPALQKGRIVCTNLPLNKDALERDYPGSQIRDFNVAAVEADPPSIVDLVPPGAVCLIDECWRLWPAGKKVDKIDPAYKSFLAEHRHRVDSAGNSTQIYLVTQDLAQLAAFARQLVEQTFITVKLSALGLNKRFRTDIFQGHPTGTSPPQAQRLRSIQGKYEARIFQYYVSHTMSESSEGGANESGIDRRGNVLLRPLVLLAPLLIVGLVVFGVYELRSTHAQLASAPRGTAAVGGERAAPSMLGRVRGAAEAAGIVSGWRTSATLDGYGGPMQGIALLESGERRVWVPLSECRRMAFDLACPRDGAYWGRYGERYPGDEGPVSSGTSLPLRSSPRIPGSAPARVAAALVPRG